MGIIGLTSIGITKQSQNTTYQPMLSRVGLHTPATNEAVQELWVYAETKSTGVSAQLPIGIYDTTGIGTNGGIGSTLVGQANVTINADVGFPAWHSITGLDIPLIAGHRYQIALGAPLLQSISLYRGSASGGAFGIQNSPDTVFPETVAVANNFNHDYSLYAVTAAEGPLITAASSSKGADIAAAEGVLTITVDDSTGVTAVTIGGIACTSVTIVNATTVTAVAPRGGLAFGAASLVVNNGTASAGYGVTYSTPAGMDSVTMTAAYADLPASSIFYGAGGDLVNLAIGDQIAYTNSISGYAVTMDGLGIVDIASAPAGTYEGEYYVLDASDTYAASLANATFTIEPGAAAEAVLARMSMRLGLRLGF